MCACVCDVYFSMSFELLFAYLHKMSIKFWSVPLPFREFLLDIK